MKSFNSEKKLFILIGFVNFLVFNIVLQLSLLLMPIFFATIISQLVNLIIGYFLNGKKVFKFKKLNKTIFKKYLQLSISSWLLNFVLIQSFNNLGANKNIVALVILPLLVLFSYLSQKYYVFK